MNDFYNVNTNHPIIPNSQEYMYYKKYVSIHSEDRDMIKYIDSSEFEIELPEDMLNVVTLRLVNWNFPSNYNTFSTLNNNINMTFKINYPYNPGIFGIEDSLTNKIFECLFLTSNINYVITIEEGNYTSQQMVTELTNKFNYAVTNRIKKYFIKKGYTDELSEFLLNEGYTNFIIVYNNISEKIWFGNNQDGFILTNETQMQFTQQPDNLCNNKNQNPDFSNFGLPGYIGLSRTNMYSVNSSILNELSDNLSDDLSDDLSENECDLSDLTNLKNNSSLAVYNNMVVPRFYYGDVFSNDNGYWLIPNKKYPNTKVYWVESLYKLKLTGNEYFYMEIAKQNCIDETKPFNISKFTLTTNQTNSIVNSSFAKISIPNSSTCCNSQNQFINYDSLPYKYYYPPAERIRKLHIRLRYHNGQLVNFGTMNYSFMIEFVLQVPQILRDSKTVTYPSTVGSVSLLNGNSLSKW